MNKKLIFCFVLMMSFLTGCATTTDHTAYSKGKSTYRVRGKTYHVLKSSKNYTAVGNASWYGKRFQHKKTTGGERFNMHAMTAAHKTLPLNSRVEVTNLKNGRKVQVRINDRGPFVHNRIIDLSYAAAKKLGITGGGVALVRLKAV